MGYYDNVEREEGSIVKAQVMQRETAESRYTQIHSHNK